MEWRAGIHLGGRCGDGWMDDGWMGMDGCFRGVDLWVRRFVAAESDPAGWICALLL